MKIIWFDWQRIFSGIFGNRWSVLGSRVWQKNFTRASRASQHRLNSRPWLSEISGYFIYLCEPSVFLWCDLKWVMFVGLSAAECPNTHHLLMTHSYLCPARPFIKYNYVMMEIGERSPCVGWEKSILTRCLDTEIMRRVREVSHRTRLFFSPSLSCWCVLCVRTKPHLGLIFHFFFGCYRICVLRALLHLERQDEMPLLQVFNSHLTKVSTSQALKHTIYFTLKQNTCVYSLRKGLYK